MAELTTNYDFYLPDINGDEAAWGQMLNANMTALDEILATIAGLGVGVEEAPTDGQNYVRNGLDNAWNAALSSAELDLSLADYVALTGDQTVAGIKTFSSSVKIPNETYGVAWAGKLEAAPKGAIYAQIQSMGAGGETERFIPVRNMMDYDAGVPPAAIARAAGAAFEYRAFDDNSLEELFVAFIPPSSWDKGDINVHIYWSAAGAGDVRWVLTDMIACTPGDSMNTLAGYTEALNATSPAAAFSDVLEVSGPVVLSVSGAAAVNRDFLSFRIGRSGSNVADTAAGDARLFGVLLEWVNA